MSSSHYSSPYKNGSNFLGGSSFLGGGSVGGLSTQMNSSTTGYDNTSNGKMSAAHMVVAPPDNIIRSLRVVLVDTTGRYQPHTVPVQNLAASKAAKLIEKFTLLLLSSLDYYLWIHDKKGNALCQVEGARLYEASVWEGEIMVMIHQKKRVESNNIVTNYLKPHVLRIQRFIKRHYHKTSEAGINAVEELFCSHCVRCHTDGLNWDLILLASDPDRLLADVLYRNKLLTVDYESHYRKKHNELIRNNEAAMQLNNGYNEGGFNENGLYNNDQAGHTGGVFDGHVQNGNLQNGYNVGVGYNDANGNGVVAYDNRGVAFNDNIRYRDANQNLAQQPNSRMIDPRLSKETKQTATSFSKTNVSKNQFPIPSGNIANPVPGRQGLDASTADVVNGKRAKPKKEIQPHKFRALPNRNDPDSGAASLSLDVGLIGEAIAGRVNCDSKVATVACVNTTAAVAAAIPATLERGCATVEQQRKEKGYVFTRRQSKLTEDAVRTLNGLENREAPFFPSQDVALGNNGVVSNGLNIPSQDVALGNNGVVSNGCRQTTEQPQGRQNQLLNGNHGQPPGHLAGAAWIESVVTASRDSVGIDASELHRRASASLQKDPYTRKNNTIGNIMYRNDANTMIGNGMNASRLDLNNRFGMSSNSFDLNGNRFEISNRREGQRGSKYDSQHGSRYDSRRTSDQFAQLPPAHKPRIVDPQYDISCEATPQAMGFFGDDRRHLGAHFPGITENSIPTPDMPPYTLQNRQFNGISPLITSNVRQQLARQSVHSTGFLQDNTLTSIHREDVELAERIREVENELYMVKKCNLIHALSCRKDAGDVNRNGSNGNGNSGSNSSSSTALPAANEKKACGSAMAGLNKRDGSPQSIVSTTNGISRKSITRKSIGATKNSGAHRLHNRNGNNNLGTNVNTDSVYAFIRMRILKIVLTIGDAFKKKLEQALYCQPDPMSGGGDGHGQNMGQGYGQNMNQAPHYSGGEGYRGQVFNGQGYGGQPGFNRNQIVGEQDHQHLASDLGKNSSLSFQSLVQVYLLISRCIETFTYLYSGVGGSGGTIEMRALAYAEKNAEMPRMNIVDRLYSGIMSDVLEAIEGCLNRFEHLFKSSVLVNKIQALYPYTQFPLDYSLPDHRFYQQAFGNLGLAQSRRTSTSSTYGNQKFISHMVMQRRKKLQTVRKVMKYFAEGRELPAIENCFQNNRASHYHSSYLSPSQSEKTGRTDKTQKANILTSAISDDAVVIRLYPYGNMQYSLILHRRSSESWRSVYGHAMRYFGFYVQLVLFQTGYHLESEAKIGDLAVRHSSSGRLYYSIVVTRPQSITTVDRVSLDLIRLLEDDYSFDRKLMQIQLEIPQEYLRLPQPASEYIADLIIMPYEILDQDVLNVFDEEIIFDNGEAMDHDFMSAGGFDLKGEDPSNDTSDDPSEEPSLMQKAAGAAGVTVSYLSGVTMGFLKGGVQENQDRNGASRRGESRRGDVNTKICGEVVGARSNGGVRPKAPIPRNRQGSGAHLSARNSVPSSSSENSHSHSGATESEVALMVSNHGPSASSTREKTRNHDRKNKKQRFYFRNMHTRRFVVIDCTYGEFLAWLEFLQHLRRGNFCREKTVERLSEQISFCNIRDMCHDLRYFSNKIEHFRSMTFGNYVPPGSLKPSHRKNIPCLRSLQFWAGHFEKTLRQFENFCFGVDPEKNFDFGKANETFWYIRHHGITKKKQLDNGSSGKQLAIEYNVRQGTGSRLLEDRKTPTLNNGLCSRTARKRTETSWKCSSPGVITLPPPAPTLSSKPSPNLPMSPPLISPKTGEYVTPVKTKEEGESSVGSTAVPYSTLGDARSMSGDTVSGKNLSHSPEGDPTVREEWQAASHSALLETPKWHTPFNQGEESDGSEHSSVLDELRSPEGSPKTSIATFTGSKEDRKSGTSSGDLTGERRRTTGIKTTPLTTSKQKKRSKSISLDSCNPQIRELTEENQRLSTQLEEMERKLNEKLSGSPSLTDQVKQTVQAVTAGLKKVGFDEIFPQTPRLGIANNGKAKSTCGKYEIGRSTSSRSLFASTITSTMSSSSGTASSREESSPSSSICIDKSFLEYTRDLILDGGEKFERVILNRSPNKKPDQSNDNQPFWRSQNPEAAATKRVKKKKHDTDPLTALKSEFKKKYASPERKSLIKSETRHQLSIASVQKAAGSITHYRGTPDVTTPAYVLGAAGSSTSTRLLDTWLIQKVVSTATENGGLLQIPSAVGPVPLKHYLFKMDPLRGMHVIRQHPDAANSLQTLNRIVPASLGATAAISATVQASIGLVRNLCRTHEPEDVSSAEIVRDLMADASKGASVGAGYWGIVKGINYAQSCSSLPQIQALAKTLAFNPTPVLLTSLGVGWVGARYMMYLAGAITNEQLMADTVFSGYSNGMGAIACIAGSHLGFAPAMCALLGCLLGSSAAAYTYECWREESIVLICRKLRRIAVFTLGLGKQWDLEVVNLRYRTLIRYAHPDKNKSPDARQTFEMIQLAREICINELNDYQDVRKRLNTLWHYLYADSSDTGVAEEKRTASRMW